MLHLDTVGYHSPTSFWPLLKAKAGVWQNRWSLLRRQTFLPFSLLQALQCDCTMGKSGQHPRKKEYLWCCSAVAPQACKMEVAGGWPGYPQAKDTEIEGKVEMQKESLKEVISSSDFLISALHYKQKLSSPGLISFSHCMKIWGLWR